MVVETSRPAEPASDSAKGDDQQILFMTQMLEMVKKTGKQTEAEHMRLLDKARGILFDNERDFELASKLYAEKMGMTF